MSEARTEKTLTCRDPAPALGCDSTKIFDGDRARRDHLHMDRTSRVRGSTLLPTSGSTLLPTSGSALLPTSGSTLLPTKRG